MPTLMDAAQLLIADVGEAVGPLELARDRLDERVLLERVEDRRPSRLHHRLELVWSMVPLGDEQRIGHQVGGALVELVEEELHALMNSN